MSIANAVQSVVMLTFSKLTKQTDKKGDYLHMQISFSDVHRAYICLCPLLPDYILVHHEYDMCSDIDGVVSMHKKNFKRYIETYPVPEFVGIREDPESDELTAVYTQKDVSLPAWVMNLAKK